MINKLDNKAIWSNDFLELYSFSKENCGLFVCKTEYIPIESFKQAFNEAVKFAEENKWKYFIFDKSNLNVFHQPSMEWYYTNWKLELLQLGINTHFKILPKEPWFKTSVEAGIAEIKEKHPDFDFSAINILYKSNVQEALSHIASNH